jgi:methylated-DNA-protein-cysteine methyltransferase-like protein
VEQREIRELTEAVYGIVWLIPSGRATSYGAIARAIGWPGRARWVGRIVGSCDSELPGLPAHRVVNGQGILTARSAFESPTRMQELLEAEGVAVRDHRIVGWKNVFWDPQKELF